MARAPAAGAAAAAAAARTGAAAGARGAATAAQRGKRELGAQPRSWWGAAAVIVVGDGGLRRWLPGTGTCWAEVAGSAPLRCSGGCTCCSRPTPAIGERLCQPLCGSLPLSVPGTQVHWCARSHTLDLLGADQRGRCCPQTFLLLAQQALLVLVEQVGPGSPPAQGSGG